MDGEGFHPGSYLNATGSNWIHGSFLYFNCDKVIEKLGYELIWSPGSSVHDI